MTEKARVTLTLPLLPLRDIVVFPGTVVPLFVGRSRSIRALEDAMGRDKEVLLAAQKRAKTNDPEEEDIHRVGTIGVITRLQRLPDGTVKVLVEGNRRAEILSFLGKDEFFLCAVKEIEEPVSSSLEIEALMRSVCTTFESYVKLNRRVPPEIVATIQALSSPSRLADTVVVHLGSLKLADRQELLEIVDPVKRLERLLSLMNSEIEILQVEKKIRSRVKKQMERTQKEYYLNEQMQAIQRELGERDEFRSEMQELEASIRATKFSDEAKERVEKELKKLKMMQPMSAEATVVRNYIDAILALPWDKRSEESHDIKKAEQVLDEDHYGLVKVKERILEHLAVQALVKKVRGPVLCLVGPPGVGKTSLARSVARATGRNFVRLALGGVRDEAEIRGHRRTYIGAMPGRIIQSMRNAGVINPVILLDEVDKMSADFRGDPSAALLEVLDPEQNAKFNDHYLDLDYDLSDVMFITTANGLSGIPLPLRDRMEIIELSGYSEFEKLNIAQTYLVPRQKDDAGLKEITLTFSEGALRELIHHYTRESGVRNLEREIGSICRKVARKVLEDGKEQKFELGTQDVATYLGVPKYQWNQSEERDEIGLTTGLAYTQFGGATLDCEVAVVPGKGKLVITGLLEKGMQESAQAAMSYIRSRHEALGLEQDFYQNIDFHIHFPEFVPKDGPSAGITMATSIASALLRAPVRRNVAMTGEITLRGRILPIGGLKEKLLAAHRMAIDTVLVPEENRKDIKELPTQVLQSVRLVFVKHMDQVLREALRSPMIEKTFAAAPKPVEYVHGKFLEPEQETTGALPGALPLVSDRPGAGSEFPTRQ